jgi:PAS domain-containing protein
LSWHWSCVASAPRSRTPSGSARVVPGVPPGVFEEDRCGPGSLALVLAAHGASVTAHELVRTLPEAPGRGVLSVDMLIAARERGFDAALVAGSGELLLREVTAGRPAILMLRLLDVPGATRDVFHYVVADGADPERGLLRFQFGDGRARWAPLTDVDGSWKPVGRALLLIRARDDTDAAMERAVSLENAARPQEAEALYREVLLVRPESVRAWVNLGNVAAGQGRRTDAETAYRRALAVAPEDRDALNNLAWLLRDEPLRLEEAEALAARAAAQPGPDRPLALDTLGRIQAARGRCGEAVTTLREALEADPLFDATRRSLLDGLALAEACVAR